MTRSMPVAVRRGAGGLSGGEPCRGGRLAPAPAVGPVPPCGAQGAGVASRRAVAGQRQSGSRRSEGVHERPRTRSESRAVAARLRPRFHASQSSVSTVVPDDEPVMQDAISGGQPVDDDRRRVGAEGRQVAGVEARTRLEPVDVAPGHPGVRVHGGEAEGEDGGGDEHRARHPPAGQPHPGGEEEHDDQAQPQLEAVDEDAQHGVAERVLVERHPVEGTGDDGEGEQAQGAEEQAQQQPVAGGLAGRDAHRQGDDDHGEEGGDGELAEALVHVLGVGQAGGAARGTRGRPTSPWPARRGSRRRGRRRCRRGRPTPTGGRPGGARAA